MQYIYLFVICVPQNSIHGRLRPQAAGHKDIGDDCTSCRLQGEMVDDFDQYRDR